MKSSCTWEASGFKRAQAKLDFDYMNWQIIIKSMKSRDNRNIYATSIYLFKVSNGNIRTMCKICSKRTIKTLERRQSRLSDIFIINLEQISQIFLIFLLLTWKKQVSHGSEENNKRAALICYIQSYVSVYFKTW